MTLDAMKDEISCCKWETLTSNYGPFKPSDEQVSEGLRVLKNFKLLTSEGDWEDCIMEKGLLERDCFAELVKTASILKTVVMGEGRDQAQFELRHHPPVVLSDIKRYLHRMDVCFYRRFGKVDCDHPNLVMASCGASGVYRLHNDDAHVIKNREQLNANAHLTMNEDQERMWTYAFTIEDNWLQLWYFSRSHSTVSESVDWKKEPRYMVSFLLSFIFATPLELGYDPNVRRFTQGGDDYWIYRIQPAGELPPQAVGSAEAVRAFSVTPTTGTFFKTLKSIFRYRTHRITGRATRVWEVIQVLNFENHEPLPGTTKVALKDVWLDATARTESQIQGELFRDIEQYIKGLPKLDTETLEKYIPEDVLKVLRSGSYKQHFLSIRCDATGYRTREFRDAQVQASEPSQPSEHTRPLVNQQAVAKRQYRVVFDQVAKAMHDVDDFGGTMTALRGGVTGLILMHLAGWVHRDISGGNVLFYESPAGPIGILSDLEYAKKSVDVRVVSSTDPKIGTPFFLSVSIERGNALHRNTDTYRDPINRKQRWREERPVIPTGVKHNFLHDLESVWWLHLYTMLQYSNSDDARRFSAQIFTRVGNPISERRWVLEQGIPSGLFPPSISTLEGTLEGARSTIHRALLDFDEQTTTPISHHAMYWVYVLALDGVELAKDQEVKIVRPPPTPVAEQTDISRRDSQESKQLQDKEASAEHVQVTEGIRG